MSTPNDTLAINIGSKNRGGSLFAMMHMEDNDTCTMLCSVRMQGDWSEYLYSGHYDGLPKPIKDNFIS